MEAVGYLSDLGAEIAGVETTNYALPQGGGGSKGNSNNKDTKGLGYAKPPSQKATVAFVFDQSDTKPEGDFYSAYKVAMENEFVDVIITN